MTTKPRTKPQNTEALWFESLSAAQMRTILYKKDILMLARMGECTEKAGRKISSSAFSSLLSGGYIVADRDLYRITERGKVWAMQYPLDGDLRWHVEFAIADKQDDK